MMKEYKDLNLRAMNTFGIEARCDQLIEFATVDDLQSLFKKYPDLLHDTPWRVLSGGSNVVFSGDFKGTLLHPVSKKIEITNTTDQQISVRVDAGVTWDDFVEWCVERNFWGVENLSHIPGYVGAAPVQNIGAYGVEAKDVIESVEMYAVESAGILKLSNEHCDFGYRDSTFKRELRGKVIITAVNFILNRNEQPNMGYGDLRTKVEQLGGVTLRNIRSAVIAIRESKLPDPREIGNAGSFFKNPIVQDSIAQELKVEYTSMPVYPSHIEGMSKLAAGWLIDQCGWKGRREGRVGIHENQALVVVNHGGATGAEVLDLAARIQDDVYEKFGVKVEMEVNVF